MGLRMRLGFFEWMIDHWILPAYVLFPMALARSKACLIFLRPHNIFFFCVRAHVYVCVVDPIDLPPPASPSPARHSETLDVWSGTTPAPA